jgi:NAD(P)H-hydrate epimerase
MSAFAARDTSPLPVLPPRQPESHKGDFGRALLIGGSPAMSGAISMSGMSALRSGAGLVRLGVPASCHAVVAGFDPCYMVTALPCDERGLLTRAARAQLHEMIANATCLGCGPGLSASEAIDELVLWLYRSTSQPAVFDADALNALARHRDALAPPAGPRILTPHPGEFARLLGLSQPYAHECREELAAEFARRHNLTLVLKGHLTIVTDGKRVYVNATGNPGMATGGTGDVLTGLLVALLGQGLNPYESARLGAYLHGFAGDLAAAKLGQISLTARDVIDFLPDAFRHHQSQRAPH